MSEPTPRIRTEFVASWKDWEGAVCVTRGDHERELDAALARVAELEAHSLSLTGERFSERNHTALQSRAESAEARVAELEREVSLAYASHMEFQDRLQIKLDAIEAAIDAARAQKG